MQEFIPYLTLSAILVVMFIITRHKPLAPTPMENHTIPRKAALEIATAQFEERPAIFHGGCVDCIWRHQNTTHTGIAFCRGCQYFAWDRSLPDKAIREYDLEKS